MDRLPESTVLFSVYFLLPLGSISHCRWPSCPTFSPLDFLYSLIQQITEHPLYTEPWGTSHTRMSLSSQCMFKDTDWWCKWTVLNYTESGLRVGAWVENPEAPVCARPLSPWQLLSPSRQHPRGLGALEAFCLMAQLLTPRPSSLYVVFWVRPTMITLCNPCLLVLLAYYWFSLCTFHKCIALIIFYHTM